MRTTCPETFKIHSPQRTPFSTDRCRVGSARFASGCGDARARTSAPRILHRYRSCENTTRADSHDHRACGNDIDSVNACCRLRHTMPACSSFRIALRSVLTRASLSHWSLEPFGKSRSYMSRARFAVGQRSTSPTNNSTRTPFLRRSVRRLALLASSPFRKEGSLAAHAANVAKSR